MKMSLKTSVQQSPKEALDGLERSIDDTFDATDADLALVCLKPDIKFGEDVSHTLHVFKVHKRIMAVPSTFFEAMMEASEPGFEDSKDSVEGLPALRMEESPDVVQVLLGAAYNKPSLLGPLLMSENWRFALDVWEASNKYSFHVLKALSSSTIQ